jgi:hypothetical protein
MHLNAYVTVILVTHMCVCVRVSALKVFGILIIKQVSLPHGGQNMKLATIQR